MNLETDVTNVLFHETSNNSNIPSNQDTILDLKEAKTVFNLFKSDEKIAETSGSDEKMSEYSETEDMSSEFDSGNDTPNETPVKKGCVIIPFKTKRMNLDNNTSSKKQNPPKKKKYTKININPDIPNTDKREDIIPHEVEIKQEPVSPLKATSPQKSMKNTKSKNRFLCIDCGNSYPTKNHLVRHSIVHKV